MPRIERVTSLRPDVVSAVSALVGVVSAADDHDPIDPHAWLDLVGAGHTGVVGVVAWPDPAPPDRAPDHARPDRSPQEVSSGPDARSGPAGGAPAERDRAVGYAQMIPADGRWSVELAVDPRRRLPGDTVGEELLGEAVALIAELGGGAVTLWVSRPGPGMARTAAIAGLHPGRALYQMRRPLPVEAAIADPEALPTRSFVPGRDEPAWLAVNNRAFDWHPEQGGWDVDTLTHHEAEPWFDADGFLLHEEDGRLVGFCWTKVHAEHDPPLGEIYVIAVDPDASRRGLGRRLVLAGLDHLARAGLGVGMLYCDAVNTRAVKLYVDLGFMVDHVDQTYIAEIAPAPAPPVP